MNGFEETSSHRLSYKFRISGGSLKQLSTPELPLHDILKNYAVGDISQKNPSIQV